MMSWLGWLFQSSDLGECGMSPRNARSNDACQAKTGSVRDLERFVNVSASWSATSVKFSKGRHLLAALKITGLHADVN